MSIVWRIWGHVEYVKLDPRADAVDVLRAQILGDPCGLEKRDPVDAANRILESFNILVTAGMQVRWPGETAEDVVDAVRQYVLEQLQQKTNDGTRTLFEHILLQGYVDARLEDKLQKHEGEKSKSAVFVTVHRCLHTKLDIRDTAKLFWYHADAILEMPKVCEVSKHLPCLVGSSADDVVRWLHGDPSGTSPAVILRTMHDMLVELAALEYKWYADIMNDEGDDEWPHVLVWRYYEHRLKSMDDANPQSLLARLFAGVDEATADAMKKWLYDTVSKVMYVPPLDEWWASWGAALVPARAVAAESPSKRVHA